MEVKAGSPKRIEDAVAQGVLLDGVCVVPGGGSDFFGLKLDDVGRGAEVESEVEVLVVELALGGVGGDVVGVDV
ncbi:hypothetical protein [Streptomyces sp. NBC_00879]|uniref:hypothetical protein n=1 Tax=Streptomyces sp. NBC_00879 TaxID=2975855 RepID=UPI003864616A